MKGKIFFYLSFRLEKLLFSILDGYLNKLLFKQLISTKQENNDNRYINLKEWRIRFRKKN